MKEGSQIVVSIWPLAHDAEEDVDLATENIDQQVLEELQVLIWLCCQTPGAAVTSTPRRMRA